jgi:hypothetical protein
MENDDVGVNLVTLHRPPSYYPPTPALGEELRVRQSFKTWRLPSEGPQRLKYQDVNLLNLERHLRGYYGAYYSELDLLMTRYPAMDEIFPEVLRGPRHIVVDLAADGIVAVHWPAQIEGFAFDISPHRLVRDFTRQHRLKAPSGRAASFLQYEEGIDFGACQMWRPRLIEGEAVVTFDWRASISRAWITSTPS